MYNIHLDFDNPEICYLLGLWWADGSITFYKVALEIKKEDSDEIIKCYDNFPKYGMYIRPTRGGDSQTQTLEINNRSFAHYLSLLDYNPHRTVSPFKVLKLIPDHLKSFWWRGYFDGDGYVHVDNKGRYGFVFSGNYDQNWDFVSDLLNTLNVKYTIKRTKQINKKTLKINQSSSVIVQNYNGFLRFLSFIYPNEIYDGIGFTRKFNKFLTGKSVKNNFENTQCQGRIKVKIISVKTKEIIEFRSKNECSRFLKIKKGILNNRIKRQVEINGYIPYII